MNQRKLKNVFNRQAGFTLIEALVAITVLIIGVLGPLVIAVRGISDGLYVKNQMTAHYLAQEGLEELIAVANYDKLVFVDWDTICLNLSNKASELGTDTEQLSFLPQGQRSVSVGDITPIDGSNGRGLLITSTVSWEKNGLRRTTVLRDIIYEQLFSS